MIFTDGFGGVWRGHADARNISQNAAHENLDFFLMDSDPDWILIYAGDGLNFAVLGWDANSIFDTAEILKKTR